MCVCVSCLEEPPRCEKCLEICCQKLPEPTGADDTAARSCSVGERKGEVDETSFKTIPHVDFKATRSFDFVFFTLISSSVWFRSTSLPVLQMFLAPFSASVPLKPSVSAWLLPLQLCQVSDE